MPDDLSNKRGRKLREEKKTRTFTNLLGTSSRTTSLAAKRIVANGFPVVSDLDDDVYAIRTTRQSTYFDIPLVNTELYNSSKDPGPGSSWNLYDADVVYTRITIVIINVERAEFRVSKSLTFKNRTERAFGRLWDILAPRH